jgi:chromosome partitioning protein
VAAAAAALAMHGVPVAPVRIGARRAYARAMASGRAVTEFAPRGKAAQEIAALWQWVQE